MKKKIEIVEDSMKKSNEKEIIDIVIKSKTSNICEIEKSKTVICMSRSDADDRIKTIIAGQFSIKTMLEFAEALDTAKEQLLKKAASAIDLSLDNLIDILGGEE